MGEKKRRAAAGFKDLHYPTLSEDRRRELVRLANENTDLIIAEGRAGVESLREDFEADVVYGVWQDDTAANRVRIALLKGYGRMLLMNQSPRPVEAYQTSIRFRDREEAWVAATFFGDLRQDAPEGFTDAPVPKP